MTKPPVILAAALAASLNLGLAGCATTESMPSTSKADATMAIAAAQAAAKQANAMHFEWNTTGKLIKQAEAAATKGDYAQAVKLADKAKHQGEYAQQQAISQSHATGPRMN